MKAAIIGKIKQRGYGVQVTHPKESGFYRWEAVYELNGIRGLYGMWSGPKFGFYPLEDLSYDTNGFATDSKHPPMRLTKDERIALDTLHMKFRTDMFDDLPEISVKDDSTDGE